MGFCFNAIVKLMESNAFGDREKRLYLEGEILGLPDQKRRKASDAHVDFKPHCFIEKIAQFRLSGT